MWWSGIVVVDVVVFGGSGGIWGRGGLGIELAECIGFSGVLESVFLSC